MKKTKQFVSFAFIFISLFIGFFVAEAHSDQDIIYPILELGSCQNETECRVYCDGEGNMSQCVDFAEKHNLMSPGEIKRAKAFIKSGNNGPGGCEGKDECETYCDDIENIEACLVFAQENDFMDEKEVKEAQQVAKALKDGANLPGGCKNKEQCESYCENIEHIDECIAFAEKAGFISGEELEEAKKAAKVIASGVKPPGNCKGKDLCDVYCSEPSHMEECLNFAETAGFIHKEEAAMARKMMPLMMQGEMPGGCRSKEQCESYCEDDEHVEECFNFAVKAGFIGEEGQEMLKTIGKSGPGGCEGKDECEKFCANPENQDVCFNFGENNDFIPGEEFLDDPGEELEEMMKEIDSEINYEMSDETQEEMIESSGHMPRGGEFQQGGDMDKSDRDKIEQEIRQRMEEEIRQGMMGDFDINK